MVVHSLLQERMAIEQTMHAFMHESVLTLLPRKALSKSQYTCATLRMLLLSPARQEARLQRETVADQQHERSEAGPGVRSCDHYTEPLHDHKIAASHSGRSLQAHDPLRRQTFSHKPSEENADRHTQQTRRRDAHASSRPPDLQ
mmetsp:Transcript_111775/g.193759  ORF Transcript_111775/g.193759 Transcript_111775/m.193759 type:complete len:144 (-) Transcript_111775:393-824(-)